MYSKLLIYKILLSIAFFLIITPMSYICKIFKYDPLQVKSKNNNKTFWVIRKKNRINFDKK
tara:strand:+ start:82 stop:264 length:183 start_codon:yes stop_codon:yes gene_type:complete